MEPGKNVAHSAQIVEHSAPLSSHPRITLPFQGFWRYLYPHWPALVGYVVLALLFFAPLLPLFNLAVPGGTVARTDGWQNVWNIWWTQQAINTGRNPFHTTFLYYPGGVDLTLQTLNISNGLLVLPVTALFGPVAGYNLALLLSFVLAGMGAYALALHITGNRQAAFLAGVLFAFSPFHTAKAWDGQLEMAALEWLPFFAWMLLRTLERPGWRDALWAGLCLALVGLTSWYYMLYGLMFGGAVALLWLLKPKTTIARWRMLAQGGVALAVGLGIVLPLIVPALARAAQEARMLHVTSGGIDKGAFDLILMQSASLLDPLLPNPNHPLWGTFINEIGRQWHPYIAEWNVSLGLGALVLGLFGLARRWGEGWRWGVVALLGWLFALGPELQMQGQRTGIALPYELLLKLPEADVARRPSHTIILSLLALIPLVALGIQALYAWLPGRRGQAVVIGLAALALFELVPPQWVLWQAHVHPALAALRDQPGALMIVPSLSEGSAPLQAQMIHGQAMTSGYVARHPSAPFLCFAPDVAPYPRDCLPDNAPPDASVAVLNAYGVRYVAVFAAEISDSDDREEVEQRLHAELMDTPPSVDDAELQLFTVPLLAPRPVVFLGRGWQHSEDLPQDATTARRRWMSAQGDIVLMNPDIRPRQLSMRWLMRAYDHPRQACAWLDGTRLWCLEATQDGVPIDLPLELTPGEHVLRLEAPADIEAASPHRIISIALDDWQTETP